MPGNDDAALSILRPWPPGEITYCFWLVARNEMASTIHKHVRPVALLMYDTGGLAIIRRPFSRWLAIKTLDAAEGGVLDDHCDLR
jgi:hypothetical protein